MNNMRRPSEKAATRAARNGAVQKKEDPLMGAVILRRYQIMDVLGEGGMGSVYLARDRESGSEVAVKVLHQSLSSDDAIARFFREVKATITVNHPNIVKVIDHGTYRDKLVCVMERLKGSDLLGIVRSADGRKLPWKRVRPIITQLCGGLYAAHRENIIHRDLKPGNIFILQSADGRERVKILDFGLAKNIGDGNDDLTKTDTIMGTFKYMAPEQTLGKKDAYDQRTDIFTVGVIMYELLTGEVPFKGENALDLLRKIREEKPVRPRVHNRDIPGYVEEIILKAMEKDPRKRFQSMKELREAIVSRSKQSRSLGDMLLANAVQMREANPAKENGAIPAEELGVAIIPDDPMSRISQVITPEPAFTRNLGPLSQDFEDETEEVRRKGGWFGKAVAVAVISAAAGLGYYYWDRISPVVTPYYEQAREFVDRELREKNEEPARQRPVATKFRARIETSPVNATVYLQGEGHGLGEKLGNTRRPLVLNLENGEHTLIIRKPGYRQSKVTVTPQNPNAKVNLRMIPRRREPIEIEPVEIDDEGAGTE